MIQYNNYFNPNRPTYILHNSEFVRISKAAKYISLFLIQKFIKKSSSGTSYYIDESIIFSFPYIRTSLGLLQFVFNINLVFLVVKTTTDNCTRVFNIKNKNCIYD